MRPQPFLFHIPDQRLLPLFLRAYVNPAIGCEPERNIVKADFVDLHGVDTGNFFQRLC